MADKSQIRERLASGVPVIGTWNTLASPLATEAMAQGGFDFQIIDLEHGPFELGGVHQQVSACAATGCSPLVRVPTNQDWMVLQALDQGAHGVVVPHIDSVAEARALAEAARYHPHGKRGFTPFSKAGGFSNRFAAKHVAASEAVITVAIVESREGLEELDAILEVDGVDVVYFGAYDISQALGCPGEVRHQKVIETISNGVERAVRAGKVAGGFVPQSKDDIKWLLDMGMRFITYEVDCSILYRGVAEVCEWLDMEAKR